MRPTSITASVVLLVSILASCASAANLTYVDLLKQLTDLDRLTHLQTGIRGGQYSSWHRAEREQWAFNADAGQYLRVEDNGEAVMMEQDGPGCIFRIWSANPQGTLRIYLDRATTPTYELDFNGLFSGDHPPFIKPLVYQRGGQQSASDCYVPIPFARHIKICAERAHGQFYHFNYLRYPDDWSVQSFRLPLTTEEQAALQAAAEAWGSPGRDPKPALAGRQTISKSLTVQPGETVTLAELTGPAQIRAIRMKVASDQRYFPRKLVLKGVWDGADWPQVLTPIGPFFGFDWKLPEYASMIAGCQDGQCYFHYPMPFRQSALLQLASYLELPAELQYEIEWAPADLPPDSAYFFARWRHEPDSSTLDYPFIETAGRGHLVGVTLQVDHPTPGWWGEGDEKVWIDDAFPNWIGTGSEDYFGDAWGIRYLPAPSFGCSFDEYPRTCPYRWHFMDFIPFEKRLRMTIENYGPWPRFDEHEIEYNSVAFWYQAERTPPFNQLEGATYIGGTKYLQAPEEQHYRTDLFRDITADDVLTTGLDVPFAIEAEDLLEASVKAGRGKVITDAQLPYEFSRERAVDFGDAKAGDSLAEFRLKTAQPGVFLPTVYTAPDESHAELSLEVNGAPIQVIDRPAKHTAALDAIEVPEDGAPVRLLAVSDGRAVLDCLRLEPAPRVEGAIEAEGVQVVRQTGGEAPHPSSPMRGPSAGRILEWHASAPGDSMALRVPREGNAGYALGVRAMNGPGEGIIQAFAGDKPIGPRFDLYAPEKRPSPTVWPLGPLPADSDEVEVRVVGKNPAAQACHVGLDYFRWEPLIIHPDSAEGVWARVLKTQGCQYRTQDLGVRFVGGHHLWLQPCSLNGFIDIGVTIPEEADYTIETRYTTSWDYAILQAFLDEQPIGDPVDLYTPTVQQTLPLDLGRVHLTAGEHVLRFQAVDQNEASKGYLMGIDYILVRRAD